MELNKKIFKAYDVRGVYPKEINKEAVFLIAQSLAKNFGTGAKIIVGCDARKSSPILLAAVRAGIESAKSKTKIIDAGLVSTPMLYFLVNHLKTNGGIMITASHNPKEYNGVKAVREKAAPISGKEILELIQIENYESRIKNNKKITLPKPNQKFVRAYVNFLNEFLDIEAPLTVVFDSSNGSTGEIIKNLVAKNQNIKAYFLNTKPDGNFSAHGPNPLSPKAVVQIEKEVKKRKADLGIIFDADGDRVFFIDNMGKFIDPGITSYLLMENTTGLTVVDSTASWLLKHSNKKTIVSKIGHYFVKKEMRKHKAALGVEQSGHYYFNDFFYLDSGILTSAKIMSLVAVLKAKKTSLSDLVKSLPKYHRKEMAFETHGKDFVLISEKIERKYKKNAQKIYHLDGLTIESKDWWLNLRPSQTEPIIRLTIEALSEKVLNSKIKEVAQLIK